MIIGIYTSIYVGLIYQNGFKITERGAKTTEDNRDDELRDQTSKKNISEAEISLHHNRHQVRHFSVMPQKFLEMQGKGTGGKKIIKVE